MRPTRVGQNPDSNINVSINLFEYVIQIRHCPMCGRIVLPADVANDPGFLTIVFRAVLAKVRLAVWPSLVAASD